MSSNIMTDSSNDSDDSDDYLIELIGLKEDFQKEGMAAYGEIYNRYWDKLYHIAKGVCKNRNGYEQEAEDLVADTFQRIYNQASSFNKGDITKKEVIYYRILKWMTSIMKNVFFDLYIDAPGKELILKENKERKNNPNQIEEISSHIIPIKTIKKHFDDEDEVFLNQLENLEKNNHISEEEHSETINEELINQYINSLPKREAEIVRETYMCYVPGKNTPKEVLDYFENKFGTKRDNVRRILKKFRDKIKEDLEEKIIIRR